MRKILKALLIGSALAAAPAIAAGRDTPEAKLARMLEGRVAGAPVDCIELTGTQSSEIIDGKAIVYRVGSRLYVNEPRAGAKSLNSDDILLTKTFGSRLCSIDTVHLIDRNGHFPRGFVQLGKFVPYSKPRRTH